MALHFYETLFQDGRAVLESDDPICSAELSSAVDFIFDFETSYRVLLPESPPDLNREAVAWSASRFHRVCQFLVYPHLEGESDLKDKPPPQASPSVDYSVDLVFRFLPDLNLKLGATSRASLLSETLLQFGEQWPLSSVGMPLKKWRSTVAIQSHGCLRRLYIDRILSRADVVRLQEDWVSQDVATAAGAYSSILPFPSEVVEQIQNRIGREMRSIRQPGVAGEVPVAGANLIESFNHLAEGHSDNG